MNRGFDRDTGKLVPLIVVTYSSIDRYRTTRRFKTLAGAQKFAQRYVGAHPEVGYGYAVSGDGVGKVTVRGAALHELFPGIYADMRG